MGSYLITGFCIGVFFGFIICCILTSGNKD